MQPLLHRSSLAEASIIQTGQEPLNHESTLVRSFLTPTPHKTHTHTHSFVAQLHLQSSQFTGLVGQLDAGWDGISKRRQKKPKFKVNQ